ncbi:MAG: helix-turn-helix domain-containing protein, partial [Verrucomicrobiota bacterium]
LTCVQLIQQYLNRIDRYNKTLGALIHVNPAALDTARRLDVEFSANGKLSGPLHCVPVVVKDAIDTAEMPTTGGSSAPFSNLHPPADATVVAKLRSAGAIIGPYEDLEAAVDYLNSHYNESITLESVAAMVHLSTSQFQRRFKALFQTSPIQYLLQLRIDSACQQLQRTDDSLGSIALENGFYDQSVFCRQFQKRIGLTPRQYRTRFGKSAKWKPSFQ